MKSRFFRNFQIFLFVFAAAGIVSAQTAKRTVTNADLEKYRVQRENADADYRENYQRRGMPSPEELDEQQAQERVKREELAAKLKNEDAVRANFYIQEANVIKTQYADVNAKIGYVQNLIAGLPIQQNRIVISPAELSSISVYGGYGNYGNYGGGGYYGNGGGYGRGANRGNRGQIINPVVVGPNTQTVRNAAAGMPNPYAGTPLYETGIKLRIGADYNYNRGGYGYGRYSRQVYGGNYFPYVGNDSNTYERAELISNLRMLEQTRAGIIAQWNLLVEEARRAGVRID